MRSFWMRFTDGTEGHCQGESAFDAVRIAEHITGKTVDLGEYKYRPEESDAVENIPYPTSKMIWSFEHPVYGKTPGLCYGGAKCRGKSSCPQRYACTE